MGAPLDPTTPRDDDIVADYPPNERQERGNVQTLIATEHYEGVSGNNRHKLVVAEDDAARDAIIVMPLEGNLAIQKGAPAAANRPSYKGLSYHDGSAWQKGLFLFTGMMIPTAFDPATIEADSGGLLLPCLGGAFDRATYGDLFTVIGTAFDQQHGVDPPSGSEFRVPNLAGDLVVGLAPNGYAPAGYARNVSGQNDLSVSGTYGGGSTAIYIVEVVSGTQFRWSDDAGATFSANTAFAPSNAISNGLTLNWGSTTGHLAGDVWLFIADPRYQTVGEDLGVSAWRLNTAEIAGHAHTMQSAGGHRHTLNIDSSTGNDFATVNEGNSPPDSSTDLAMSSEGAHTHTINSTGGDQAHPTSPKVVVAGQVIVA